MGVFLVWYQLSKMTAVERSDMWEAIKMVNPLWIVISLLFGLFSHFSRAYRWKYLLEPLGYKPKFITSFMAIMIGYFANTFIIRSGEVLRGVSLSNTDNIPFEKAFGTIVAERIADLIVLLLIMTTAVILQSTALVAYFQENANPTGFIILLAVGLTAGIFGLRLLKKSSHPLIQKIRNFGLGLLDGVKSILNMQHNTSFILHTLFIWGMYIGMFWIMKYTVPGTAEAPLGVILASFVIGAFAMSATNAGMGLYPIAMAAIFTFFGYEDGATFGWLLWGTQTIFNVIIGGICALILLLIKRR
ncbi:lysylphosphatidylglycerol synthase transmembrane domain-containing protein [Dokdonia sp. PRO95]|uniref:lysylphosphatidylglycerol synthase transmembrane domain-containing protein n=1 Tax=Dokdonia sp. PRO95 TaxID=1239415 RepID=UPI00068CFAEE|nr:lysylphosphatidylglycerol synthase transmembrane domain-containing protein [Dokdonia sp. PRO95]